jgi:ATP-dependent helicase YprA (DUF1998 family)
MADKENQNGQNPDQNAELESLSKIDAIKELIFGNNIKEYEAEFNEIKAIIQDNHDTLDNKLENTKNDIFDALEELRKDMNRQIDELQLAMNKEVDRLDDQKTDRSLLVKLFSDMAKKIDD